MAVSFPLPTRTLFIHRSDSEVGPMAPAAEARLKKKEKMHNYIESRQKKSTKI